MYSRKKMTIKGRASQRVFPPPNALRTKRPVFYSPGEFTGRGSETHLHKEKSGDSPLSGKTRVELKFTPKTKKTTRRPVGRELEKWSTILRLLRNPLSNSKRRIFQIPPDGVLQQSRKILREIHKNCTTLK